MGNVWLQLFQRKHLLYLNFFLIYICDTEVHHLIMGDEPIIGVENIFEEFYDDKAVFGIKVSSAVHVNGLSDRFIDLLLFAVCIDQIDQRAYPGNV